METLRKWPIPDDPLQLSRLLLRGLGTRTTVHHLERVPAAVPLLVVSNHRSMLDAPLLMSAMNRPIRFACHHYMSQVPLLRELVNALGAVPLDTPGTSQRGFFQRATQLLQAQQTVGIFPEGGEPMITATPPDQLHAFHRGFAHLACRTPLEQLVILPVAIAATQEIQGPIAPFKIFNFFAPSEPLFDRPGWHPAVIYQRASVLVGRPIWITAEQRQRYQGKQAISFTQSLTQACHEEIAGLLQEGHAAC